MSDEHCYEWTIVEIESIKEIIKTTTKKRTIIQAGANVGAYAKEYSNYFDKVIAIEPEQTNFLCLCLNTQNNKNIFPFRTCLGNNNKCLNLLNNNENNCGTFFVSENGNIPQIKIDDLKLNDVDCIHLDLEGYEYFALLGAEQTIKATHPIIVTEWLDHFKNYNCSKEQIENLLFNFGYKQKMPIGSDIIFK